MEILVDGKKRHVDPLPDTMGELIHDLKSAAAQANRVVLSIAADGQELDVAAQREIAWKHLEEFSSVSVETADAKVLCLATLEESARHIQPVVDEANRIGELIAAGKDSEALRRIAPCLEVWSTILTAVEKVAVLLELDIREVVSNGASLNTVIEELSQFLHSLKSSIESRDLVAVRDAMKHEMPEIAGRLEAQLGALCSAVSAS